MYHFMGPPAVVFDGALRVEGGTSSGSMFNSYNPRVIERLAEEAPLALTAYHVRNGANIDIEARVALESDLAGAHRVEFVICLDDLHDYPNMAIDMLEAETLGIAGVGQTAIIQRTFATDGLSEADIARLRIVVFVQNENTLEIRQGALTEADYAGRIDVVCEPAGLAAPWTLSGPSGLTVSGVGDKEVYVFEPGIFTLTWHDIPVWHEPVPETATVVQDGQVTMSGTFTSGPFRSTTVLGTAASTRDVNLADIDGDGDLDVHLVLDQLADRLLVNDGHGGLSDVATGLIADTGAGRDAAWADLSGDGIPDLCLARYDQAPLILAGDGLGGFTTYPVSGVDVLGPATGVAVMDFNLDRRYDLFFSHDGQVNVLLKNFGTFGDATYFGVETSSELAENGPTLASTWSDFDLDGRLDCYLVRSGVGNMLMQNLPVGFGEVFASPTADESAGRAADWGDFDHDGDFDLVLVNGDGDGQVWANDDGDFTAVQTLPLTGRGAFHDVTWDDLDNDTHLDLFVTGGGEGPDALWLGDGAGAFVEVLLDDSLQAAQPSRVACGDLDGDGSLDLVLAREGGDDMVRFSAMGGGRNWVAFDLTGVDCPSDAIGARLLLSAGGVLQTRIVTSDRGSGGADLHFGLGDAAQIDGLLIYWPDGTVQSEGYFGGNRVWEIVQGQSMISPVQTEALPRATTLGQAYPNPFNPQTTIAFTLTAHTRVRIEVFTIEGKRVTTLSEGPLAAGSHRVTWNGCNDSGRPAASGQYFYRLSTADGFTASGRVTLLK